MFKIINKQNPGTNIRFIDVEAKTIAAKLKAGQFVLALPQASLRPIPLTVMDTDSLKGILSLVFEETDSSSKSLGEMKIGDSFLSLLGPLGTPISVRKFGTVACVGFGVGIAQILPVCRELKKTGNRVLGIVGAHTRKSVIFENRLRLNCDKIFISTEDGTYERRGSVVESLREVLDTEKVKWVYAVGPLGILKDICDLTKQRKVPTVIYYLPPILEGVGLTNSCRVKVMDQELLASIDGPQFDGHQVDFKDLERRVKAYEELNQWPFNQHNQSPSNPSTKESKILSKFLSGILKSKP